jgi:HEAT repeat protein
MSSRLARLIVPVCALSASAVSLAGGQSLAQRVSSAPDGPVQFSFASRSTVCGNGRTYINVGQSMWFGSFNGSINETTRTDPCVHGPVRVVLGRAGKEIVDLDAYVGPSTPTPGATDLGTVAAKMAADYLLSLASTLEGKPGRSAILPAMLADSSTVAPGLLALAKDQTRPRETRRSALSWLGNAMVELGEVAPDRLTGVLRDVAKDENDNQSVRQQALHVLARLDRGDGIPALIDLAKNVNDTWLGKQALSSLASSGDPRARQYLRTAVVQADLPEDMRVAAIRGIGQEYASSKDIDFLRDLYGKIDSDHAKEQIISSISETGGSSNVAWLIGIVKNDKESIRLRQRAAQSAERAGTPAADLVKLYDASDMTQIKETVIGVLAQNGTRMATDKLLAIAKTDPNYSLRRRAVNSLSRSSDPKVRQALQDMVEK